MTKFGYNQAAPKRPTELFVHPQYRIAAAAVQSGSAINSIHGHGAVLSDSIPSQKTDTFTVSGSTQHIHPTPAMQ
jgi:hypothetical protein